MVGKSCFEFLTKKQLINSLSNEQIIMRGDIEEKLRTFNDEDVLVIELTANSSATIINIQLLNIPIVDFMTSVFQRDGIQKGVINKAFEELNST